MSPYMRESMLLGIKIVVSPDRPKYVLPEEVIPGVPWPPGFRDEINAWALRSFGTWNVIPDGTILMIGNHTAVVRPHTYAMLKGLK